MNRLTALIQGLDLQIVRGPSDATVAGLTDDSRQVQPGDLFIARQGPKTDGQSYIRSALERGATVIVTQADPPADLSDRVTWVRGSRIDQTLAGLLAERYFDHPSRKLHLIGVTGTNGKTTTTTIIQHLLAAAGIRCGLIGTVAIDDGGPDGPQPAQLTTPGSVECSRLLSRMVEHGCQAAVAEVSSHALHQGRTAALTFDVAVFTNLTGDHLDYHGTMEAYASAKGLLFEQIGEAGWAIVNANDRNARRMIGRFTGPGERVLGCAVQSGTGGQSIAATFAKLDGEGSAATPAAILNGKGQLCAAHVVEMTASGSWVRMEGPWGSREVALPLVGRHNISNAIQAVAASQTLVTDTDALFSALEKCPPVPGRLEPIPNSRFPVNGDDGQSDPSERSVSRRPTVVVDYAHTDDALENVLIALRPVTRGRLIVLFGCGGDRDRTKRPRMAQVATRLADVVWITSDNPRSEDPQLIIDDILQGVPSDTKAEVHVDADRGRAIANCVAGAQPDDTVLLAGKGHEDYQIVGQERLHFDDRQQAVTALKAWD